MLAGCSGGARNAAESDLENEDACGFLNHPVDLTVPWDVGGGSDVFGRQIAQLAEPSIGEPIVVQNLPGASGETGMTRFMSAEPDGHALVQVVFDFVLLNALGQSKTDYKDLHFLMRGQYAPSYLFAPAKSDLDMATVIERAKADPGTLRVAGSGVGSPDEVTITSLSDQGLNLNYAAYDESGERYLAPLQGDADLLYEQTGDIQSFLESGDYRPIVAFSSDPVPGYEDVPTISEFDLDVTLPQWRGIAIQADAPAEAKECWEGILRDVADSEDYKEFLKETDTGAEPPLFGDDFNAWVEEQYQEAEQLVSN